MLDDWDLIGSSATTCRLTFFNHKTGWRIKYGYSHDKECMVAELIGADSSFEFEGHGLEKALKHHDQLQKQG